MSSGWKIAPNGEPLRYRLNTQEDLMCFPAYENLYQGFQETMNQQEVRIQREEEMYYEELTQAVMEAVRFKFAVWAAKLGHLGERVVQMKSAGEFISLNDPFL